MFTYLVQGTYSGAGSFSASAQTADKERSAQAQVNQNSIDIVDELNEIISIPLIQTIN